MLNKYLLKLLDWIDIRFPLSSLYKEHLSEYYAPKNLNFLYAFGFIAIFIMFIQFITGIWLAMNYTPSSEEAFNSVEYIMRDVSYGWLLRYTHSTGASFFFIAVYLHMFRAFLYGSYKNPRELLWLVGMIIYLCLMMESFFGYLLPWGNMSFWGAQVITSLFSAIPIVGVNIVEIIRGDYNVSGITLNRFFSLHVTAVPLLLTFLVVIHIMCLHQVGSNNPTGIEIKDNKDKNGIPINGIPLHPYYSIKDLFLLSIFLFIFAFVIFFMPEFGGYFLERPNFIPADSLTTPEHIAPVWYMTPFYAILRAVPDKLMGVLAMIGAILILFILPWLDRSKHKAIKNKGIISKIMLFIFCINFCVLGFLGMSAPTPELTLLARICTSFYFIYFLAMPFYSNIEKNNSFSTKYKGK